MTMTYSTLVDDIKKYADRNDEPFVSQIPRLIALAEYRIAEEVHGLGYRRFVGFDIAPGQYVIFKPANWRESTELNIGTGPGNADRKFLLFRGYEYTRRFWPNSDDVGEPRFYSDYSYESILIAPTNDVLRPAELGYHEKPEPLSPSNEENWTTKYAPNLLLYATLLETMPFLMRADRLPEFQALYQRASDAIIGEEKRRLTDASTTRKDVS